MRKLVMRKLTQEQILWHAMRFVRHDSPKNGEKIADYHCRKHKEWECFGDLLKLYLAGKLSIKEMREAEFD